MYMFLDAAPYAFIETLRDRMFKPTLSTLVTEHTKYDWMSSRNLCYLKYLLVFNFSS